MTGNVVTLLGRGSRCVLVAARRYPLAERAQAQTVEEFYRGKTINMVIGYPAAGANDRYARTIARHIGKYIPGHPNVISRNMPGGGSLIAANHVFNVAPKDGTVISLLAATIPLEEALGTQGAKFKSAQFNWIGRMASSINITFTNANAPVKTIKDAFTQRGDPRRHRPQRRRRRSIRRC